MPEDMAAKIVDAAVCTRIRDRAYNLYCDRGHRDGLALQDWLQAEAQVLNELKVGPLAANYVSLEAQTKWEQPTQKPGERYRRA